MFTKAEEFSCIRCFRGGFLIRACSSSHDRQMCIMLSIVFASAMACVYGCVLLFVSLIFSLGSERFAKGSI